LRPAANGSGRIDVRRIDSLDAADLADSFGVFHSEKDALKALTEIAHAKQLCLKVLGLEQSEGSCFAFQIGKCRGACVGKEPLLLHSTRVQLALSALKIKRWPFPGRIALRERRSRGYAYGYAAAEGATGGAAEREWSDDYHVLDQWAYLGTARCDEELASLSEGTAPLVFDVDVYRLLTRYFANHPKLDWHSAKLRGVAEHWPSAS
jgi:DNA polymerase-3 subunit epsilon